MVLAQQKCVGLWPVKHRASGVPTFSAPSGTPVTLTLVGPAHTAVLVAERTQPSSARGRRSRTGVARGRGHVNGEPNLRSASDEEGLSSRLTTTPGRKTQAIAPLDASPAITSFARSETLARN